MADTSIHYLTYDPEAIWQEMQEAYIAAGGRALWMGDEKEMLLRAVQSIVVQAYAAVDNALRMQTLRYAVGSWLDLIGENRGCARVTDRKASAFATFTFAPSGVTKVIRAGTQMTNDGEVYYELAEDLQQSGLSQVERVKIVCTRAGAAGNGLVSGQQLQLAVTQPAVISVICTGSATGGGEAEDDETYRERIRRYMQESVTTGPAQQYEAAAMAVSTEILDAKALRISDGVVGVYLITESETGQAALVQSVEDALNDQETRPLTDTVQVSLATAVEYSLVVQYKTETGVSISSAVTQAVLEYQSWQDTHVGRAFNPDRLMAAVYNAGAIRVVWGDASVFDGSSDIEYTEILATQHCKGTISLEILEED